MGYFSSLKGKGDIFVTHLCKINFILLALTRSGCPSVQVIHGHGPRGVASRIADVTRQAR